MRFHSTVRSRVALAISAAVPVLAGSLAFGQAYSTTPVTIYTAAAGGGTSISLGLNSTSNVLSLIDEDPSILAGYVTSSTNSTRAIYNYNVVTKTASTIFLTDTGHSQTTTTPTLGIVTSSGLTVGYQNRQDPVTQSGSEGTDVLISNNGAAPTTIPLPTTVLSGNAVYSYTDTSHDNTTVEGLSVSQGTTSFSNYGTNAANSSGVVAGQITRYGGPGTTFVSNGQSYPAAGLGTDGFYYNPITQTTTAIGLSGGVYDATNQTTYAPTTLIVHGTTVTGTAGTVGAAGFTTRTDNSLASSVTAAATGRDAWYYTPNNGTQQIGLVGGIYATTTADGQTEEVSTTYRTNSLGQVAGSTAVNPNSNIGGAGGVDAWLYTPPTSALTAPTTASTYGGTAATGTYTRLGLSVLTTPTVLGNISPTSTSFRNTNTNFLTNAGYAAGTSNREDTSGNFQGAAAWYYNGSGTPVDISPTDSIHPAVQGGTTYSSNTVTAINNTGMVAANATRVSGTTGGTALGQDAYVYDSLAQKDFYIDPTDEATSGYEYSWIGAVSDKGVAVGYYNTYVGTSSTVTGSVVFDWTETGGMQALQTYTGAAASGSLAAYVDSFQFDANGDIFAPNTYGTGATSIIEYTAVPEPTTATLLALGAIGLLRRRRLA